MATGYKVCKICGKEYKYCMTNRRDTIFRWQDVACSPAHGAIYFERIALSRGESVPAAVAAALKSEHNADIYVDEDIDNVFEEEFDNGDEEIAIEQ